jgi:23S rRNA pseudouridine1911/1915/1917 synthase
LSRHVVAPDEAGKRADVVVARLALAPRSLVADAVRRGTIRVNGAPIKASHLLEEGDVLEYAIEPRPVLTATAEAIDVPIVYEDDAIIVVDKPAGMTTHPAPGSTSGTLINALLARGSLPGGGTRPGLIHRLDRDTSGLLVVAKSEKALEKLQAAMRDRRIERTYLGLVHGVPEHARGTLDGPIGRDPHNRLRYAIVADGKPAITHYQIRETFRKHAELEFSLETGRTHQIRVHMAGLGHPIVNDPIYGHAESRFALAGQALHAWRLRFPHPQTGEMMSFETPPPPEYAVARALLAV